MIGCILCSIIIFHHMLTAEQLRMCRIELLHQKMLPLFLPEMRLIITEIRKK